MEALLRNFVIEGVACQPPSSYHFVIQLFWSDLNFYANLSRSKTWSRKTTSWIEIKSLLTKASKTQAKIQICCTAKLISWKVVNLSHLYQHDLNLFLGYLKITRTYSVSYSVTLYLEPLSLPSLQMKYILRVLKSMSFIHSQGHLLKRSVGYFQLFFFQW